MNSTSVSTQPGFVYRAITSCIAFFLPERMKRILFVSSLAAQLSKDQTVPPEALSKINELLDLAHDSGSMELGVELSNVIWKDAECSLMCFQMSNEQFIAQERIPYIISIILKATAPWLRYGKENDGAMEKDIRALIDSRATILP